MMKHLRIIYLLFLAMTLVACGDKVPSATSDEISSKKQTTKYPGKPSAPIEMRFQILTTPELGLSVSVEVTLIPGVDAENLHLTYTTSPDLTAGDNVTEFNYSNVIAGQSVVQTISVIPQADGLHYINLIVKIDSTHTRSGTRAFAIPVSLGSNAAKSKLPNNNKVNQTPAGERLIIKRAKENRNN